MPNPTKESLFQKTKKFLSKNTKSPVEPGYISRPGLGLIGNLTQTLLPALTIIPNTLGTFLYTSVAKGSVSAGFDHARFNFGADSVRMGFGLTSTALTIPHLIAKVLPEPLKTPLNKWTLTSQLKAEAIIGRIVDKPFFHNNSEQRQSPITDLVGSIVAITNRLTGGDEISSVANTVRLEGDTKQPASIDSEKYQILFPPKIEDQVQRKKMMELREDILKGIVSQSKDSEAISSLKSKIKEYTELSALKETLKESYDSVSAYLDNNAKNVSVLQKFVAGQDAAIAQELLKMKEKMPDATAEDVKTQLPTHDLQSKKLSTIVSGSQPFPVYDKEGKGKLLDNRQQDCIDTLTNLVEYFKKNLSEKNPEAKQKTPVEQKQLLEQEIKSGDYPRELKLAYFASGAYAALAAAANIQKNMEETPNKLKDDPEMAKEIVEGFAKDYIELRKEAAKQIQHLQSLLDPPQKIQENTAHKSPMPSSKKLPSLTTLNERYKISKDIQGPALKKAVVAAIQELYDKPIEDKRTEIKKCIDNKKIELAKGVNRGSITQDEAVKQLKSYIEEQYKSLEPLIKKGEYSIIFQTLKMDEYAIAYKKEQGTFNPKREPDINTSKRYKENYKRHQEYNYTLEGSVDSAAMKIALSTADASLKEEIKKTDTELKQETKMPLNDAEKVSDATSQKEWQTANPKDITSQNITQNLQTIQSGLARLNAAAPHDQKKIVRPKTDTPEPQQGKASAVKALVIQFESAAKQNRSQSPDLSATEKNDKKEVKRSVKPS